MLFGAMKVLSDDMINLRLQDFGRFLILKKRKRK